MKEIDDLYKSFPKFPAKELEAYITAREQNVRDMGMLPITQAFLIGSTAQENGVEIPVSPPIPFRYTITRAIDDVAENPGYGIAFVTRWWDPNDPDQLAAYEAHQEAAAKEKGHLNP